MWELINIVGYQLMLQIIMGVQLACVVGLILERKDLSIKKALAYLFTLLFLDLFITLSGVGIDYYTVIIILMVFIIYKGKILHRVLAISVSIAVSCISEILNRTVLDYILGEGLELGVWDEGLLQLGSMILIIVGIIVLQGAGIIYNNKRGFEALPRREVFVLSGLSIATIFIWGIGLLIYDGGIQAKHNPKFLCALIAGVLLLDLGILVIIDKNIHTRSYKQVNDLMEKQLIKQVSYYARLEEITKDTRAVQHDMANHMICMKGLLESGEISELHDYIDSVEENIKINTNIIRTGNVIVDAIINEKYRVATEKSINIDIDVALPKDINIQMVDLCTIISNGIDNAIEACEKIPLVENREIQIAGKYTQGYFIFNCINKTVGHVEVENNTVKTTKWDGKGHGFGLWNIKNSVDKYKGELKLSYREHKFRLEIIINTSYV